MGRAENRIKKCLANVPSGIAFQRDQKTRRSNAAGENEKIFLAQEIGELPSRDPSFRIILRFMSMGLRFLAQHLKKESYHV